MLELAHFKQGEEADECIQEVRQHVRWKTQTHIYMHTYMRVCAVQYMCRDSGRLWQMHPQQL